MLLDTSLWLMVLWLPSALCASRRMARTAGADVYCAGTGLEPPRGEQRSAVECSVTCQDTAGCVAISYRKDSECVLHAAFCDASDLHQEAAAVYAGQVIVHTYKIHCK